MNKPTLVAGFDPIANGRSWVIGDMFWLVLVAFLAGLLRVPASALQLARLLPSAGPTWYLLLQAAIGLVQFAIGLAMLVGLRKTGTWGAF